MLLRELKIGGRFILHPATQFARHFTALHDTYWANPMSVWIHVGNGEYCDPNSDGTYLFSGYNEVVIKV